MWLDGFYAKGSTFERPRFRCVPRIDPKTRKRPALHANGDARHKFVEPLARRHERGTHPACRNCEHVLDRHEGPQTARGHVFSIHEAARDLVAVGTGTSLRGSSRRTRREAGRTTVSAWGNITASPHAQLASDHLGSFGQVILDAFAPPASWPDAVVLDSRAFPITMAKPVRSGKVRTRRGQFHLLAAVGYPAGRGTAVPWRVFVRGGADAVEWEAVLSSLSGAPSWVVCDDDKAIKSAVRKVWPKAVIHTCEGHLQRLLLDRVVRDHVSPYSAFASRVPAAISHPARWAALRGEAAALGMGRTMAWMRSKAPMLARQHAAWQPGRPRSNGAVEHVLDEVGRRLGHRRYAFRNVRRLELLLNLMLLDIAGEADEFRYRAAIRGSLLASAGRPAAARRRLDDSGPPSLHEAVGRVMLRTARKRRQNRRHARASWWRKRASGIQRTAPRPSRVSWPAAP